MLTRMIGGGMLALWIAAASTGAFNRSLHITLGLSAFVLISVHMILRHTANESLQGWKKTHTFLLSTLSKLMVGSGIVVALYHTPALVQFHRIMVDLFGLLMFIHLWTSRQWIVEQFARWRNR